MPNDLLWVPGSRPRREAIKLFPGVYAQREPTGRELAELLSAHYPDVALTGDSAIEVHSNLPIALPLRVVGRESMPASRFIRPYRSRVIRTWTYGNVRVQVAALAVAHAEKHDPIEFLESYYGSRNGTAHLERDLIGIRRLPSAVREALDKAVVGTDSGAERILVRRLRESGLKVSANYKIGDYYWDVVIKKSRLAIEIDGFEFHSTPQAAARDAWKANDATLRGWTTLRYTGHCLHRHLEEIVEQILTAREPDFDSQVHKLITRWHALWKSPR